MIKLLKWDSQFFNKKIGELEIDDNFENVQNASDYDLLYVKSNNDFIVEIENFKPRYSEIKVVFRKILESFIDIEKDDLKISTLCDNGYKNQLYFLATVSGEFSRFKLDPNFSNDIFLKLYETWVDNSISGEIAEEVLVYIDEDVIKGFVTFKYQNKAVLIGLIAVLPSAQGVGIGYKLMRAVEKKAIQNNIEELIVQTQLKNKLACKFYKKLGYKIILTQNIKHFWKL